MTRASIDDVLGEHPFAQVAELDHQDDAVRRPCARGGRGQGLEHATLGVEAGVGVPHDRSTWLSIGDRIRVTRPCTPRSTQRLEVLDAGVAEADAAAAQHRGGDRGRARGRLGHPGDPDAARRASRSTRMRVLCSISSRSISSRGALIERSGARASVELRERASTMSTRRSGGRVSGSVAGMPSSSS